MQTKEQNWGSPGNKVIDQHGTNEVNLFWLRQICMLAVLKVMEE